MKKNILFFIPENSVDEKTLRSFSDAYTDIEFLVSDTVNNSKIVEKYIEENEVKIMAARGKTASLLKKTFPKINVIEIPISPYDVFRSLEKDIQSLKSVAFITTKAEVKDLELLGKMINIKLINFLNIPEAEIEKYIFKAREMKAELILGGAIVRRVGDALGVDVTTLKLSSESINRTISETYLIKRIIDTEKGNSIFLESIFNNIVEGLVVTDLDFNIKKINPIAKLQLDVDTDGYRENLKLGDIMPELFDPSNLIRNTGVIVRKERRSIYNLIYSDEEAENIICILHEAKTISELETQLRIDEYTKNKDTIYTFNSIFGKSKSIKNVIAKAKLYSDSLANVFIFGESGTGKELFAQSIHNYSERSNNPFLAVNCASIPESLLESELFGYASGAFTGASKHGKAGVFEQAHKGTVFLDEIGDMNFRNQASLLRVIQEKYIVRVGSNDRIPVDVRIISATNKELYSLVREGLFREDLYYRLNVLELMLPPLRERRDDIIPYVKYYLNKNNKKFSEDYIIHKSASNYLTDYDWPGNFRELQNFLERVLILSNSPIMSLEFVKSILQYSEASRESLRNPMEDNSEKQIVIAALKKNNWNREKTAENLNVSRSTLWRYMKKYNIL